MVRMSDSGVRKASTLVTKDGVTRLVCQLCNSKKSKFESIIWNTVQTRFCRNKNHTGDYDRTPENMLRAAAKIAAMPANSQYPET